MVMKVRVTNNLTAKAYRLTAEFVVENHLVSVILCLYLFTAKREITIFVQLCVVHEKVHGLSCASSSAL